MMRLRAVFALACYFAGALVTPALHRLHHARYGEDHEHGPGGMHLHHAAFDADAVALDLGDVALAGTLTVDCSLAEYTLVSCGDGAAADVAADLVAIGHAPNFGDELLARLAHSRRPHPPDPLHGHGAPEHVVPALLVSAPILLPLPPRADAPPPLLVPALAPPAPLPSTHAARGPPAPLAT
ncbi:MAG TPA: hypothetical protein VN947_16350 [Polyangia bacterium]|nr:hypothetical protein [Polyangia bacterium]